MLGSGRAATTPITTPGELQALHARGHGGREPSGPFGRRSNDTQPTLLVAEHQTLGRGRLGRIWQSGPGTSLTFSLGLPMAPRDWSGLSLAVGVTLADALEPPEPGHAPRLWLKWPNDLWLVDGPAAGASSAACSIETVAIGRQRLAVVGVGLNVRPLAAPAEANWPPASPACRSSTRRHAAVGAGARGPAARCRRCASFEARRLPGFAPAYARRDLLAGPGGAAPDAAAAEGVIEGVVCGVVEYGALQVQTAPAARA